MKWTEKCILDLAHHNLFENDAHRRRFHDLLDCYFDKPFFSKGLCKCMYLSAWDTDHFMIMLDALNSTLIEKDSHLTLMKDQGDLWQREAHAGRNYEGEAVWELANDFLAGRPYDRSKLPSFEIEYPDTAYIIKRALSASALIDDLPEIRKDQSA